MFVNNTKPEIINKIQKLLDHHAGCLKIKSEEEALSALDIAKRLMEKHHLNMMMFEENKDPNSITDKYVDKCSVYAVPIWLCNIINVVNNMCNCSCVLQKQPQSNGYIHISVVFVSLRRDMDKISNLYQFLKKTTYKLANSHIKEINGNYTNWRSFSEGFTSRLLEKSRLFNDSIKDYRDIGKSKDATTFDDSDFEESETDDEFDDIINDFEEFEDENNVESNEKDVVVDKQEKKLDIQIYEYFKIVKDNIKKYIEERMQNVHYEDVKRKSKVFINSYEIGRIQAENINLNQENKTNLLLTNKNKKGKKQ